MSASSLAIYPSRWRRSALLIAAGGVSLLFLLLPLRADTALLAWLLLSAWFLLLWRLEQHAPRTKMLMLDDHGQLRWFEANLPDGQLRADCMITPWLIQLSWCDQQGRRNRCCLYADQLSQSDYRKLARQLITVKWQQQVLKN